MKAHDTVRSLLPGHRQYKVRGCSTFVFARSHLLRLICLAQNDNKIHSNKGYLEYGLSVYVYSQDVRKDTLNVIAKFPCFIPKHQKDTRYDISLIYLITP